MSALSYSVLIPAKAARVRGSYAWGLISFITLATMFALSRFAPDFYSRISQEDQVVEWLTASLFFSASGLIIAHAVRTRRLFDGLVGLFCLLSAAEEISWGQRLFGLNPPGYFLSTNLQQEISLHNLTGPSIHDVIFATTLLGYFVLLPLVPSLARRIGSTTPAIRNLPVAIAVVLLYIWDPVHMSTEWVELTVAGLFFSSSSTLTGISQLKTITVGLAALIVSLSLANWSSRATDSQRQACARVEVGSLLNDLLQGAATEKLYYLEGSVHRRMFAAESTGYVDASKLKRFAETRCLDDQLNRQQYVVDPWGMSYWFFVEQREDGDQKLTIYSFGPNRRRDNEESSPGKTNSGSDDIAIGGVLSRSVTQNH